MFGNFNNSIPVCVLGGSGFIGRHLLKALSEKNAVDVRILTRNKDRLNFLLDDFRVVLGDLMDLDSLVNFLESGAIVINLAYLRNSSMNDNIRAMKNLAQACAQKKVFRVVHCSTAVVVGCDRDDVISEETVCSPVTDYEKTKLLIENILTENLYGKCEFVIVRPTAVFGEYGKNLLKFADELVSESRLLRIIKTSLFSRRKMNLVCVENVVEAIIFLSCFKGNIDGQCYLVSDDEIEENNYYDVSRQLARHFDLNGVIIINHPLQPLILKALLILLRRVNTNFRRIYSTDKLFGLGFKKAIAFQDGIEHFAMWYKNTLPRRKRTGY